MAVSHHAAGHLGARVARPRPAGARPRIEREPFHHRKPLIGRSAVAQILLGPLVERRLANGPARTGARGGSRSRRFPVASGCRGATSTRRSGPATRRRATSPLFSSTVTRSGSTWLGDGARRTSCTSSDVDDARATLSAKSAAPSTSRLPHICTRRPRPPRTRSCSPRRGARGRGRATP
jgi:hypothetical protein